MTPTITRRPPRLAAIAALVALALTAFACDSDEPTPTATPTTPTPPVTLPDETALPTLTPTDTPSEDPTPAPEANVTSTVAGRLAAPPPPDSGQSIPGRAAFVDETEGWWRFSNRVFHSDDRGATWTRRGTLSFGDLRSDFDFAAGGYGWAATADGLEATTDGGWTWAPLPTGHTGEVDSLDLAGPGEGWLVQDGAVLHTTDGGGTWDELPNPCAAHATLPVMSFADSTYGWAFCHGPNTPANQPQELWVSEDAGDTWTRREVPPQDIRLWGPDSDLSLFDRDHAWYALPRNGVYSTADGGQTWTRIAEAGAESLVGWPDLIDEDSGIALSSSFDVNLLRTDDGKWFDSVYAWNDTSAPDFVTHQMGFAPLPGPGPLIPYETRDGGATWSLIGDGRPAAYTDFVDERTWFQLRYEEPHYNVWKTANAGQTWTKTAMSAPVYEPPAAMRLQFFDASNGILIHGYGSITTTTDGGVTAETRLDFDEPTSALVYYAEFVSNDDGWIIARPKTASAALNHTTDGGRTWSPVARFDGGRGLAALPGGEVWVTEPRALPHTKDFGQTWQRVTLPNIRPFHLTALPGHVWVVDNAGRLYHSSDDGATWEYRGDL